ncbi:MAG: holo-[acyl-carrier-protein] synthase [Candidatus Omnitrophica bacterium]|nr:holo-[acyl-carrier-protein] synthase [Candidatus Omnitrophota bacterium]
MKLLHGIDIASVSRIQKAIENQGAHFLSRVFTPAERAYCEPRKRKFEHYAARFAAKEAVMKALGVSQKKRCEFREIEVLHAPSGKPLIRLDAKAHKRFHLSPKTQIEISLSHDFELAVASVLVYQP